MTALDDLVTFARIEQEAHDIEPWAEVLGALDLDVEPRLWLVSLYNAFDDLGSAWRVFERFPSPEAWSENIDEADVAWLATLPCSRERRGLRGGRVVRRIDSYTNILGGLTQQAWLTRWTNGDPAGDFLRTTELLRRVWGVGRQSAFEWAEFLAKSCGYPLVAGDAQLWESSGPRHSLESLYEDGGALPKAQWWLDRAAITCRDSLAEAGVHLSWEDFETVICDYSVMTKGRYYPGQHLAALWGEIDSTGETRLADAFESVIPAPWRDIAPGIDKARQTVYRDTGRIIDRP